MPVHVSSTMCSSLGVQIVLYSIWYRHNYRWPYGAQVERTLSWSITKNIYVDISKYLKDSQCKEPPWKWRMIDEYCLMSLQVNKVEQLGDMFYKNKILKFCYVLVDKETDKYTN